MRMFRVSRSALRDAVSLPVLDRPDTRFYCGIVSMPKIQRFNVPPDLLRHLLRRARAHDALELPAVLVDAKKAQVPLESDILTKAALSEYFLKRHPGASRKGQDPTDHYVAGPPNYALVMYRDDERLSRLHSLKRIGAVIEISGDHEGAKSPKSEVDRLLIRRPTPVTDAMDRSVNLWRRK